MVDGKKIELEYKGKKRFPKRLIFVFLVAAIAGAAYIYREQLLPAPEIVTDDKLAVLEVRLQNLDNSVALYADRLTKLEKDLADTIEASAANKAAIASHEHAVANGQSSGIGSEPIASTGEETRRIEALEKELAELKTVTSSQDNEQIAQSIKLLSTYHRLSDRVLSGKPYADELSALEDVLPDTTSQNKALTQLATYAENGVPTQAELITTFDNAVDQLNTTQAVPPAEAGPWDRFVFNISTLVRVQRTDIAPGDKNQDAVIARASAHLDKDEIEAAYAEISTLPEAVRADFSGWMEDAQIAIDAPGMVSQIEEQVMQQVFAKEQPADKATGVQ